MKKQSAIGKTLDAGKRKFDYVIRAKEDRLLGSQSKTKQGDFLLCQNDRWKNALNK